MALQLSKFRSQNRANQLRPARILISPAKHSRERPRVLESPSLYNPPYKRVCLTAICQYNFSRGFGKKSVENSLARRLIFCDPWPKVIRKRTPPSGRVAFHTARIPHAVREMRPSAIDRSQYCASVGAKRFAIGLQNAFQQRRGHGLVRIHLTSIWQILFPSLQRPPLEFVFACKPELLINWFSERCRVQFDARRLNGIEILNAFVQ